MAKKKFGKFVALATISGVIAAGVSYFLKYKSFHDELDEDFHDFEGDEEEFDGELPHAAEPPKRTYVSLNEKKEEAAEAIKEGAMQTAETVKDTAQTAADTAKDMAKDMAETVADKTEAAADTVTQKAAEMSDMVKDAVKETADAVKHAAAGSMSTTIEEDSPEG